MKKLGVLISYIKNYKTPILYTGSSIIKSFASIIVSFVIAKYVSPGDLGLWSTISLALTYSVFLQGGVINGLNLELPYAYGKGCDDEARRLTSVAQTYIVFISGVILLIGLTITFIYPFQDEKIKWGVMAITLVICFTFYQSYLLSTFRSNDAFLKLSYIQMVDAFVNICTLFLIVYFAYFGMILKAVMVILIYVSLLHVFRPIKVKCTWDKKSFIKILKTGLPIFALILLDTTANSIDKIWLVKFSTLQNVGFYSFAFYALTSLTLFSGSVASYIYPRMTYNYGKNRNKLLLWNSVKKITLILFGLLLPIVIIGYIVLPLFIKTYFSQYVFSTVSMQILLIAGLFKGSVIGVNVLWSIKKWKYMFFYQITYSILFIALTYICFKIFDNRIEGIAIGVLLANIINLLSGLTFSYFATHD